MHDSIVITSKYAEPDTLDVESYSYIYSGTRFRRHLVYNVRYAVVPINSSLLTILLYYSFITTLVYNDRNYSVRLFYFN
jgi:hypothetical protein